MKPVFKPIDNQGSFRVLLTLLAIEWVVFVFSGVSFSYLHNDPFFSIGVDPLYWLVYGMGIPQLIVQQQWLGVLSDAMIFFLFGWLIYKPSNNKIAIPLFLLLLLFYLALTGYHTHRNFQTGFFLVLVPFLFKKEASRCLAYNATRYFLLFFYASSAVLKLFSPAIYESTHFSRILTEQFTAYFLEGNTGFRTDLNLYLVTHPGVSQLLFMAGLLAELTAITGFFTKRFDRWLAVIIICFHLVNWVLMDIAPIGQLAFVCLLFMNNSFKEKA